MDGLNLDLLVVVNSGVEFFGFAGVEVVLEVDVYSGVLGWDVLVDLDVENCCGVSLVDLDVDFFFVGFFEGYGDFDDSSYVIEHGVESYLKLASGYSFEGVLALLVCNGLLAVTDCVFSDPLF